MSHSTTEFFVHHLVSQDLFQSTAVHSGLTESGQITILCLFCPPGPRVPDVFVVSLHVLFTFLCFQIAAESLSAPVSVPGILKTPGRRKLSSNNRVEFLDNLQEKEIPGRHA